MRELEDDGRFSIAGSFERSYNCGGAGYVDRGNGEGMFLSIFEELEELPSVSVLIATKLPSYMLYVPF